ncbi:MAG: YceD family protein [Thermodesulfovibrionales bacterium]
MKILVSDIPEEGLDIDIEEKVETEYPRILSPVKTVLHVDKIGDEILLRGRISADVELRCSRCLKDFKKDMSIDVDVVYHSLSELKGEEKYEIKEDELDTGFYLGDEIDVNQLLLEQIILNIPMKPLCSESCKGLCPKCGKDLNIEGCDCERKGIDPRFEKLKKLFNDRKE